MLHKYVNERMIDWSYWILKRDGGAQGYPKECPYTRLVARGGVRGFVPDLDSNSVEVDKILCNIKKLNKEVYRVMHLFYGVDFKSGKAVCVHSSAVTIAQDLQCHRDTVYAHLERGHRLMLDGFHENDVIAHVRK